MKKEYKFGISTTVDYSVPFETQIKLFRKHGFHFISLGAALNHSQFFDKLRFKINLEIVKNNGLELASSHSPFYGKYDIAAVDGDVRKKAIDNVLEFIETSADYNIPAAIIHPHSYFDDDKADCFDRAAKSLEYIIKNHHKNVDIAIENLPDHRGSWICAKLLDTFDASEIGFCFDSSHENMSGKPFHILKQYYYRITMTHLSDNHGHSDEHLIPGDGNINWVALKGYLDQNPALNDILFEIGTGEVLAEPLEMFLRRAEYAIMNYFG